MTGVGLGGIDFLLQRGANHPNRQNNTPAKSHASLFHYYKADAGSILTCANTSGLPQASAQLFRSCIGRRLSASKSKLGLASVQLRDQSP